jgi:anti-sigma B factor antagonist
MPPLPIEDKGGVLVVRVSDSALNEFNGAGLRQGLYAAMATRTSPRVAIDLSGIDYVSSTGIALLIGTKRRVDAAQGQLVLFSLHPEIFDLFNSMKLTVLFEIATDESEALKHFPALPAS